MDQLIQAANGFELNPNSMNREDGLIVSTSWKSLSHSLTKCRSLCCLPTGWYSLLFMSLFFSSGALTAAVYCPPAHHTLPPCTLYLTSLLLNPRTAPCRATTLIHVGIVTGEHGMGQVVVMLPSGQHDQVLGWVQSSGEKCSLSPPIVSLHCSEPVALQLLLW
jgi:hypothetical protein